MYLKKLYKTDGTVKGVEVIRAPETQCFSPQFVTAAMNEGWLQYKAGTIIIHDSKTLNDITYKVISYPGYHCCFCHSTFDNGDLASAHVSDRHNKQESPDKQNPLGYRRDNFYTAKRT